ncbi:MAG: NAD(+) diphosphatase, partial [bacterium]
YARGMTHWHRRNRHCGRCGSPARSRRGGHMRQCADAACATELFPRIDPAVIMLVEQTAPRDGVAKCLLGHSRSVPRRVYSTLAGYVDPGESLEEAVAREVMEETGIEIHAAAYCASQPWAFPGCLMIGFRAAAREQAIVLAPDELEDARWFSADEVRAFAEYDAAERGDAPALPRRDSIARTLVDAWLREQPA